jgi:hypothetical protein
MAPNIMPDATSSGEKNVRNYYREVLDSHKLPSLPVVASKVLEMIQDPDISRSFAVYWPTMPRFRRGY